MLSVLFSWEPSLAFLGISIGAHWLSSQWTAQAGRLAQWLTSCAPSRPGRTWMCICGQQGCKICRGSHQCLLLYIVVSAMLCYGSCIYIYIDYTYLHVDSMPAFVRYLGHLSIAMCSGLLLPREGQVCWDAGPCAQMAGQWSRGTLQHSESRCWYQCPWFKTRIKIPQQKRNRAWSLDGDLSSEPPHDRL